MKSLHVVGVAARPVSDLLPSASDVCATSGRRSSVGPDRGFWYLISCVSGIRNLETGIWNLETGIWKPVTDFRSMESERAGLGASARGKA